MAPKAPDPERLIDSAEFDATLSGSTVTVTSKETGVTVVEVDVKTGEGVALGNFVERAIIEARRRMA